MREGLVDIYNNGDNHKASFTSKGEILNTQHYTETVYDCISLSFHRNKNGLSLELFGYG